MTESKFDFRLHSCNYGCNKCLEEERYSRNIGTDTLFFRFLNHSKCDDCYIYRLYQELEYYRNMDRVRVDDEE